MAKTKAAKWGNSLALRLPKTVVHSATLHEGDEVDIQATGKGALRIVRIPKRTELKDLVSAITSENRHKQTDWGPPRGSEIW